MISQVLQDISAKFYRVVRVWRFLTLVKRAGQAHGIDRLLPHRRPGCLVLRCPACPKPGFNAEPGAGKTPDHLR